MYNPGDRVELVYTNDKYTRLEPGSQGTVDHVNWGPGFTQIAVNWDDGSSLMMIPEDGDQLRKVEEDEDSTASD